MGLISISNHKKVTWTKFEQNPLENKSFEIFISETPDSQRTFGKMALTASREPKSTYLFYNHNFFVSKLSFSVKKLKKTQMGKKLWLLEVTVKICLELVLFKWCISQFFFSKITKLSWWVLTKSKNMCWHKKSAS